MKVFPTKSVPIILGVTTEVPSIGFGFPFGAPLGVPSALCVPRKSSIRRRRGGVTSRRDVAV